MTTIKETTRRIVKIVKEYVQNRLTFRGEAKLATDISEEIRKLINGGKKK